MGRNGGERPTVNVAALDVLARLPTIALPERFRQIRERCRQRDRERFDSLPEECRLWVRPLLDAEVYPLQVCKGARVFIAHLGEYGIARVPAGPKEAPAVFALLADLITRLAARSAGAKEKP